MDLGPLHIRSRSTVQQATSRIARCPGCASPDHLIPKTSPCSLGVPRNPVIQTNLIDIDLWMSWHVTECHRLSWYVYIPSIPSHHCQAFLVFRKLQGIRNNSWGAQWNGTLGRDALKPQYQKFAKCRMEPLSFSADGLGRFSSKWTNDRYLDLLYLMISWSEETWRRLHICWWYVFSLYCCSFWMKRV